MSNSMNIGRTVMPTPTDYEKLRRDRVEENKRRMEEMGLHNLASSFMTSFQKNSKKESNCKQKLIDDDEEYMPSRRKEDLHQFCDDVDEMFLRPHMDKRTAPEVQRVGLNRSSKRLAITRSSNNHPTVIATCTEASKHPPNGSNDVEENMTPDEAANNASISRPKRGPTRNLSLAKKKAAKQKLLIEIAEDDKRVVGVDSKYFIAEGTCVIRKHAPLNVTKWSKLSEVDRELLRKMVAGSFEVKDNTGEAEKVIDAQLNRQYRNYRYKLHLHFQKYRTLAEALKHPLEGMAIEYWDWICHYFASPTFKKMSDRCKHARAKQTTPHTAGTKSFARICKERKANTGNEPGHVELYGITHKKSQGGWVNEDAGRKHEQMVQLQCESQLEGADPMNDEEICVQVLGHKSGFVRARGSGQKISSLNKKYKEELEEYKRRAEQAEQKNNEMQLEIKEVKEGFKEEMKAYTKTFDEEMKAYKNDTENTFKELLGQMRNAMGMSPL